VEVVTGGPSQRLRRRKRAVSAGQAIVEFALITPVFFLVFFSIVEFALITASIGSYDFATRDGARVGAIFGPTDPCIDTDPGTTANCQGIVSGITGIVATIGGHVQGLVMARATEIDIYDADPSSGQCISSASGTTVVTVAVDASGCYEEAYSLQGTSILSTVCPGCTAWPASNRNDSVNNDDYLGVRVLYQYTYVTGFVAGLGTNLSLSATSIQELEPQTTDVQHRTLRTAFDNTRNSPRALTMVARWLAGSPGSPVRPDVAPSEWWLRKDLGGYA
jgi:TadE-like protein